jgi:hypothetical protein
MLRWLRPQRRVKELSSDHFGGSTPGGGVPMPLFIVIV